MSTSPELRRAVPPRPGPTDFATDCCQVEWKCLDRAESVTVQDACSLSDVFTGIVRERGRVDVVEGGGDARHLLIKAPGTSAQLAIGDSVSIDSCCLTATAVSDSTFSVTAVPESLSRTTLGRLEP